MKLSVLSFLAFGAGAPLLARADGNPDFERDAKPILAAQPGLVHYVHAHFVVKETGVARVPGGGGLPPQPPFIFSARPRGVTGPFYLRLLIQPGPEGRILKVADVRQLPPGTTEPPPAPEVPETAATSPASEPIGSAPVAAPAPPSAPPADDSTSNSPSTSEHSGPIRD